MRKGLLIAGIVTGVIAGVGAVTYLMFSFVTASGDETRPGMRAYRALAKRNLVPSAQVTPCGVIRPHQDDAQPER